MLNEHPLKLYKSKNYFKLQKQLNNLFDIIGQKVILLKTENRFILFAK